MLTLAGNVIGGINQRKGTIVDTETRDDEFTVTADVPLNDMFGCTFSRPRRSASGNQNPKLTRRRRSPPLLPSFLAFFRLQTPPSSEA